MPTGGKWYPSSLQLERKAGLNWGCGVSVRPAGLCRRETSVEQGGGWRALQVPGDLGGSGSRHRWRQERGHPQAWPALWEPKAAWPCSVVLRQAEGVAVCPHVCPGRPAKR